MHSTVSMLTIIFIMLAMPSMGFKSPFPMIRPMLGLGHHRSSTKRAVTDTHEMIKSKPSEPLRQNAPGNIFVDDSCINCDVCRWMCPSVYGQRGLRSVVIKQPEEDSEEKLQAYAAMIACPVGAIHAHTPDPVASDALDIFPAPIDATRIPGVYHCGHHAQASFGATSYFIKRPKGVEGGNILIDCPRFNERLADNIEKEGGVHSMIITHRDDICDHRQWKVRFPDLQRIMHVADITAESDDVEIQISGTGHWFPFRRIIPTESESIKTNAHNDENEHGVDLEHLEEMNATEEDEEEEFEGEDVVILHTPGHTAGSLCVMYDTYFDPEEEIQVAFVNKGWRPEKEQIQHLLETSKMGEVVLFSGDTVCFDGESQRLDAFSAFNHGSLEAQEKSIREILADEGCSFQWILPAHGRMHRFSSTFLDTEDDGGSTERVEQLLELAERCTTEGMSRPEEKKWRMRQKVTSAHPMA